MRILRPENSGDASPDRTHEARFLTILQDLYTREIRRIYLGHGPPRTEGSRQRLREQQRTAAGD